MPQASMPAAVEVYYKLRTQRLQELRLGAICSQPDQDSDSVLADIQNEAEFAVDFDPANEKYDLFYRSVNESGVGKVISIKRAFINTTLSGALNATTTSFNLVPPANTDSFKVGSVIEIESEFMVLLTWNSGTGAATVEERGAHGTEATSHADATEVAKMIYTVPHNSIILSGNLDSSLPLAPTTLVVTNAVGAIGNGLSINIGLPTSQIKSLFRVHIQVSTVLWPEDFENTTGTIGVQATGADGAIVQGGTALITSVTLSTSFNGKLIHTYESINLLTGEVSAPDILRISTVVDNGDGTWTVNISGDNVYNLRRGALGVAGVVNWTIIDDFATPGNPATTVENIKPFFNQGAARGDPDVLAVQHILFTAETAFVRARLRNFEGYGPWMYHNGTLGTTTRLSATTFTPGHMQGPAIEPGTIGETEIADNSITAKLLTENAMNFNTDLVFTADDADTVSWGTGTIEFADGSTFSIGVGDTGNMTGLVFIYLDPSASATTLLVTSSRTTAVGDRKQIICVAKPAGIAGEDAFFVPVVGVFGINGSNIGPNSITEVKITDNAISAPKMQANSINANSIQANAITAVKIQALAITAGKIAANVVTATEINVVSLSAINVNLGEVTAGTITGVLYRTASSGRRVELRSGSQVGELNFFNSGGTNVGFLREVVSNLEMKCIGAGITLITTTNSTINLAPNSTSTLLVTSSVIQAQTTLNMTENSITNVGDIQLDSLTADSSTISVNDSLIPIGSVNLGSSGSRWNSIFAISVNFSGGATLGDSSSDVVVFNARIQSDFVPTTDNSRNLGISGLRWANIWATTTHFGDVGFANDWRITEYPLNIDNKDAIDGLAFIDNIGNLMAVLHKDGYLYCKGIRRLEELPA